MRPAVFDLDQTLIRAEALAGAPNVFVAMPGAADVLDALAGRAALATGRWCGSDGRVALPRPSGTAYGTYVPPAHSASGSSMSKGAALQEESDGRGRSTRVLNASG
jgi:hypothetical protein